VRSLQAVDEAVGAIVGALAATGRLANTYVVFASDNGWTQGEHRIRGEKSTPYEEAIRTPLFVAGPGLAAGSALDHLVGNADLAPTIAEWAGATMPAPVDGRSFAPLLRPGAPGPGSWRQAYPLNQLARVGLPIPSWRGVRTRQYTYVEYATGEKELYDNGADPYQLRNVAKTADPALLAKLARRTAALATCESNGCRTLEDAPL
jgi:arylsulfatase A-like enzyme